MSRPVLYFGEKSEKNRKDEGWIKIFLKLDYEELMRVRMVSKYFLHLMDNGFWEKRCEREKIDLPPRDIIQQLRDKGLDLNYHYLYHHAHLFDVNPYDRNIIERLPLHEKRSREFGREHKRWLASRLDNLSYEKAIGGLDQSQGAPTECLVTNFHWGHRRVVLNLPSCGIEPWVLDIIRPTFIIQEKHRPNAEGKPTYQFTAELLDEKEQVPHASKLTIDPSRGLFFEVTYEQCNKTNWEQKVFKIENYPEKMRKLCICTRARDPEGWGPKYGLKFADTSIQVEFPKHLTFLEDQTYLDSIFKSFKRVTAPIESSERGVNENPKPDEFWRQIFLRADYEDLLTIRKVCRQFYRLLDTDLWKNRCKREGISLPPKRLVRFGQEHDHQIDYGYLYHHAHTGQVNPYGGNIIENLPMEPFQGREFAKEHKNWMKFRIRHCTYEAPPVGVDSDPGMVTKCLATSHYWGKREIKINLERCGVEPWILDHMRPKVVLEEKHAPRFDCAGIYKLIFKLSKANGSLRGERIEKIERTYEQWASEQPWVTEVLEISGYQAKMRKVYVSSQARDRQSWAGEYGCKFADTIVRLEFPEDLEWLEVMKEEVEDEEEQDMENESIEQAPANQVVESGPEEDDEEQQDVDQEEENDDVGQQNDNQEEEMHREEDGEQGPVLENQNDNQVEDQEPENDGEGGRMEDDHDQDEPTDDDDGDGGDNLLWNHDSPSEDSDYEGSRTSHASWASTGTSSSDDNPFSDDEW